MIKKVLANSLTNKRNKHNRDLNINININKQRSTKTFNGWEEERISHIGGAGGAGGYRDLLIRHFFSVGIFVQCYNDKEKKEPNMYILYNVS